MLANGFSKACSILWRDCRQATATQSLKITFDVCFLLSTSRTNFNCYCSTSTKLKFIRNLSTIIFTHRISQKSKHQRKKYYKLSSQLAWTYVPAEAGHDGSTAGGTNCLSMGSASVPMGTQDKHDLLLRITPASSPTGEEEEGKLPDASQGARSEPRRKFRTEAGGSSLSQTDPLRTSDNVYWILRRHLSAIYAAGACPAKQLPHGGLGLACRPPLPAAGRRKEPAVTCKKPRARSPPWLVWRRLHCSRL